jgi:hypothetical protein
MPRRPRCRAGFRWCCAVPLPAGRRAVARPSPHRLPVEILGGARRLLDLALHLTFDVAGGASEAFFQLTAQISGGADHTILVHGHILVASVPSFNNRAMNWFKPREVMAGGTLAPAAVPGALRRDRHGAEPAGARSGPGASVAGRPAWRPPEPPGAEPRRPAGRAATSLPSGGPRSAPVRDGGHAQADRRCGHRASVR